LRDPRQFAPEFADMHLQAAEDLRADAAEKAKKGGQASADETESQLKLASILADGGLPKIARLDVSSCCFPRFRS
jgi:hypothetical protein